LSKNSKIIVDFDSKHSSLCAENNRSISFKKKTSILRSKVVKIIKNDYRKIAFQEKSTSTTPKMVEIASKLFL
jgi:hypothetical protein